MALDSPPLRRHAQRGAACCRARRAVARTRWRGGTSGSRLAAASTGTRVYTVRNLLKSKGNKQRDEQKRDSFCVGSSGEGVGKGKGMGGPGATVRSVVRTVLPAMKRCEIAGVRVICASPVRTRYGIKTSAVSPCGSKEFDQQVCCRSTCAVDRADSKNATRRSHQRHHSSAPAKQHFMIPPPARAPRKSLA